MPYGVANKPKIVKGETLYSLIARYHLLSGNAHERYTYLQIFNTERVRLHAYLPSRLSAASDFFNLDKQQLLNQHTLFPLFQTFTPTKQGKEIQSAMLADSGGLAIEKSGLPQSHLMFFTGHKFCPLCIQSDRRVYGFAFWHIEHQIPGISACHQHSCQLKGISSDDFSLDRKLVLPPFDDTDSVPATPAGNKLAQFSSEVFDKLSQHSTCFRYQDLYRALLNEKGYLTRGGQLRMAPIVGHLTTYWRELPGSNEQPLSAPEKLLTFSYLGTLLRPRGHCPCHPLKHLLFSAWLFNQDPNMFWNSVPRSRPSTQSRSSSSTKNTPEYSLSKIEKPGGQKHRALVKALYGCHRKEISKQLNLSVGMVETLISTDRKLVTWRKHIRFVRRLRKYRKQLQSYIYNHPKAIRQKIKNACSREFFWLYHYDKHWLERALPAATNTKQYKIRWAKRDKELVKILTERLNRADSTSIAALDKELGNHRWLTKFIDRLPYTRRLLADGIVRGKIITRNSSRYMR